MKSAATSTMPVFEESLIRVGKVAVALAVCKQRQQGSAPEGAVEALLLVKEDGAWRIAAQGRDKEHNDAPIPKSMYA